MTMLEKYIEENKKNIINAIIKMVNYKSISTKTNLKEAPFGIECKKALDYIISLGKDMGFKTKNIDGYCGYIEFGEGKEMVGIIGHLDVVPANYEDGWTSDPFKAEIRDNKIYGRGSIDDKGPVIACLYAMKYASKNYKLNKRVRLIIGLNEEKDWEGINRYKQTEELPTIGFSPDASFPCIYAEKGIITLSISKEFEIEGAKILEAECLNNAINVVPKIAYIVLETSNKEKYQSTENINIEELTASTIKITSEGKSAHAAFPTLGDNAITKLLMYINKIENNNYLEILKNKGFFELENPKYLGGKSLTDESGILTSNIAYIKYQNNRLTLKAHLRIPVNTTLDNIEEKCKKLIKEVSGMKYNIEDKKEKLYIKKDNYLVKTLTKIFNEETLLNEEPLTTGGATYARAFDNCISYGMTMPNEEELCHQVDENVDISNLLLATKIYAKAIIELGK